MIRPTARIILVHLCHLWILFAGFDVCLAQDFTGHRLSIGPGTILLVPDSQTGLTLWARRDTRPGSNPSPDFVGWFEPESVAAWTGRAREFLSGSGEESRRLVARDSGFISLMRQEDACCVLAFGHPSEWQRWVIEGSAREMLALLDTLALVAGSSRLDLPAGLIYANPTNRSATPDRTVGPLPAFRGDSGEVWARMELDSSGAVVTGTGQILWATNEDLGRAVLVVLPRYRYKLKTRLTRIAVYQRFRITGSK